MEYSVSCKLRRRALCSDFAVERLSRASISAVGRIFLDTPDLNRMLTAFPALHQADKCKLTGSHVEAVPPVLARERVVRFWVLFVIHRLALTPTDYVHKAKDLAKNFWRVGWPSDRS